MTSSILALGALVSCSPSPTSEPAGELGAARQALDPPTVNVTGTWNGTLDFSGTARPYTVQLYQRADGQVIGYIPGGTSYRTVLNGSVSGNQLSLELRHEDAKVVRVFTFAVTATDTGGTENHGHLVGTAQNALVQFLSGSGTPPPPVTVSVDWSRTLDVLTERRFVFVTDMDGSNMYDVGVVTRADGSFVSGGYVTKDQSCFPWGCGGGVTSFSEVGNTITVGLATGGGCSAGSQITATFDPGSLFYSGSSVFYGPFGDGTCNPTPTTASHVGAKSSRSSTDAAASVLAALGQVADDLESGTPASFPPSYGPVSSSYLHEGLVKSDLLASFQSEVSSYGARTVVFDRFHDLVTQVEPQMFPGLEGCNDPSCFGIDYHDKRTGTPTGGGSPTTYRDGDSTTFDELRYLQPESGIWRIRGNGISTPLDLPFAYNPPSAGDTRLVVPTAGGSVYVSLGAWGAHFSPQTGHAYGDAKSNLMAFFTQAESDLLACSGPSCSGPCLPSTTTCGLARTTIVSRRPVYIAPRAGAVRSVQVYHAKYVNECLTSNQCYLDDEAQWQVQLQLGNIGLQLGHVGQIHSDLRTKVDAARASIGLAPVDWNNPDAYVGAGNLLGSQQISVALGDNLALPQVLAKQVAGTGGTYYTGSGGYSRGPWVQIETFANLSGGGVFCWYSKMPASKQTALQQLLANDMADPNSIRYTAAYAHEWQFAAEAKLCNAVTQGDVNDFSALDAYLGGWFERASPGTTRDELIAFAPIHKDTATWTSSVASLGYLDPVGTNHLVTRLRAGGVPFSWTMSDTSAVLSPFYPAGEVIVEAPGYVIVRWRDLAPSYPSVFQKLAYQLDSNGLRVKFGGFWSTQAAATGESLSFSGVCNDTTELCYDHQYYPGF